MHSTYTYKLNYWITKCMWILKTDSFVGDNILILLRNYNLMTFIIKAFEKSNSPDFIKT